MQRVSSMDIAEGADDRLHRPAESAFVDKVTVRLPEKVGQRFTFHVGADHVRGITDADVVEDFENVGMVCLMQKHRLIPETLEHSAGELAIVATIHDNGTLPPNSYGGGMELLDRNTLQRDGIARFVEDPESVLPDHANDLVTGDVVAGGKLVPDMIIHRVVNPRRPKTLLRATGL